MQVTRCFLPSSPSRPPPTFRLGFPYSFPQTHWILPPVYYNLCLREQSGANFFATHDRKQRNRPSPGPKNGSCGEIFWAVKKKHPREWYEEDRHARDNARKIQDTSQVDAREAPASPSPSLPPLLRWMRATAGPNKNPNVSDRWNKLKSPVVIPRYGYTLLDRAHGWMKISPNSLRCLIEHDLFCYISLVCICFKFQFLDIIAGLVYRHALDIKLSSNVHPMFAGLKSQMLNPRF